MTRFARLVASVLLAGAALCPFSARAYAPGVSDTRHVDADANGQGCAVFGADDLDFHTVRRWNAVDIVGVARADAQVLVDGRPALRDGPRFLYSLPLAEGSPAHVTNITLLARITGDDEEWVARRSVALRIPACPEEIGTALTGAVVSDSLAEYLFDARNRLRRVTDKVGAPRLRAVYDYYPDGRRARKVVSLWTNQQWVAAYTNQYLYDRWNLVREVVADSGTVTTRDYTWGLDLAGLQSGTWEQESGGIGGLLAVTEVSGTATNILLPISDHIGTVHSLLAVVTNSVALAQPAVVAEYDYAPYGQLISADGPLVGSCPFGFQSKYYDPETGFWYFGHRYFDAKSCKWLTADPLGEAGGLNLTAFCGGDPVNQVDALGLSVWGDLDADVDRLYRANRPFSAFFYDFGVRAWNGFSFGMLERQSAQEDALLDGDISLGRYALGASANAAISGAKLALTVGGAGQVSTSARGAATFMGAVAQGGRVGAEIALLGSMADNFGAHLSDTLAGVGHQRTLQQESATVFKQTVQGGALGATVSGLTYGGLRLFDVLQASRPPVLDPKIAATFDGTPTYRSVNELLYRAEDAVNSVTYGRWYGLVKPDSAATAEQMYNVYIYGNNLTELSTYQPLQGAMGWVGKVRGGTGYQVYFDVPRANVKLLGTEPLPQAGF